jgi:hypothetical protein
MSLQTSSCRTHIKCSQIIKDSTRQQNLKGKTQFIVKIERGKTPYDSSIATKPVFTSRSFHLKNMRERDTTHSYWYIPSAPRENYSLLIMETSGMMKMASEDDSPLRKIAGKGSRLVSNGYRGFRRKNFRSRSTPEGFGIFSNLYDEEAVERGHEGGNTPWPRHRPGARPCGCCLPQASSPVISWPTRFLLVQKKSSKSFNPSGLD